METKTVHTNLPRESKPKDLHKLVGQPVKDEDGKEIGKVSSVNEENNTVEFEITDNDMLEKLSQQNTQPKLGWSISGKYPEGREKIIV